MAISVAISCLHFDKRKGLMSSLESRNDVVRCNRQQRYKFIVNGTWTMFHDVINVDAHHGYRDQDQVPLVHPHQCLHHHASLPVPCGWRVHQLANPQGAKG